MRINKIKEYMWQVHSDSGKIYTVIHRTDDTYFCTCQDFKFREHICKHIKAVLNIQKNESETS